MSILHQWFKLSTIIVNLKYCENSSQQLNWLAEIKVCSDNNPSRGDNIIVVRVCVRLLRNRSGVLIVRLH